MTTQLFKRLKSSKQPTPFDIQSDLIDYHIQKPAATEATYGQLRTAQGKTSYEILLDSAGDLKGKTVVDLACGNGPLIELMLSRSREIKKIIGIDLCQQDLELARSRIKAGPVDLRCEPAQKISVTSNSIDVVVCHLAFFLFNPIESVVDEISRILKPRGIFCTILSGTENIPFLFDKTTQVLKSFIAKNLPHLKDFGWGDKRTWTLQGLKSLFTKERGFGSNPHFGSFLVTLKDDPQSLANRLVPFFYSTDLLEEEARSLLKRKWTRLFETNVDTKGEIKFEFPLNLFKVSKEWTL